MRVHLRKIGTVVAWAVLTMGSTFGSLAMGQTNSRTPEASSGQILTLPEIGPHIMQEIEAFSQKTLDPIKDLEGVKRIMLILLALEDLDPSRTAVMILSESYNRYPKIYLKAIKSVENKRNRKQLKEIHEILDHFAKEGNG